MCKEEKLRCDGFVEKVGFEPRVKEWNSDGCWEWRWWQRWVDKWVRRWIETGFIGLTEWFQRRDDVYLNERSAISNDEMVGGRERVTKDCLFATTIKSINIVILIVQQCNALILWLTKILAVIVWSHGTYHAHNFIFSFTFQFFCLFRVVD